LINFAASQLRDEPWFNFLCQKAKSTTQGEPITISNIE